MKLKVLIGHSPIGIALAVFLCVQFTEITGCANNTKNKQNAKINFQQADMMLEFLVELKNSEPVSHHIESLLKAEGTELIINQMNIVRKVSLNQYEQLLKALADHHSPDIEPVDDTERAKHGVTGLKDHAWVALNWALENTDILRERLTIIKEADVYHRAKRLAHQFLPESIAMSPSLFIVMGGRVGAAALDGDRVYIDLLIMTYQKMRKNLPFMSESEMTDFFAHEMHHIGLRKYYKNKFGSLSLNENQHRLLGMLRSIVSEGSATYLISNHRNMDEMQKRFQLLEEPNKQQSLLNSCEALIRQLMEGKFKNQNEYEKANQLMLGHGYHTVGSIMLSTVDQVGGWETIKKVLADPRTLLLEYNKAAQSISDKTGAEISYIFDAELSKAVSLL